MLLWVQSQQEHILGTVTGVSCRLDGLLLAIAGTKLHHLPLCINTYRASETEYSDMGSL
jgi:hypothetical protein